MKGARHLWVATAAFTLVGCATGVDYGPVRHAAYVEHPRCAPQPQGKVDLAALPLFVVTSRLPDCRSDDIELLRHRSDHIRFGRFAAPLEQTRKEKTPIFPPLAFQDQADWWRSLEVEAGRRGGRILLYVHGYRETFTTTAIDAAQIGRMTGLEPAVIAYSWPSQGDLLGYAVDETNMYHDARNFRDFLKQLAERSWVKDIVIVSHSLAARLVIPAISHIDQEASDADASNISTIILASPDIDRESFDRDIAEEVLVPRHVANGRHMTIYVSLSDRALAASRTLHGYPRLGSPYCFEPHLADDLKAKGLPVRCYAAPRKGLSIVDTTDVSRGRAGHSNYLRSAAVCRDFIAVVRGKKAPARTPTHLPHVFRLLLDVDDPGAADNFQCGAVPPE